MRKHLNLVAVVVLFTFLYLPCVHAAPNDAEQVRTLIGGFVTAWNHHDMDAFGKLFAPDAEFVNVTGILMKGRQEIQNHHAWAHAAIPENSRVPGTLPRNYGIFKSSTMKFDTIDVRFLGGDVALAHVKWQLFDDSRSSTPRHGIFLFVLTRGKQGWQIAAAQNTEINRTVR